MIVFWLSAWPFHCHFHFIISSTSFKVEAAGWGQGRRGAPEVVVACANAWGHAACADGSSLEVLAVTNDKIHKGHMRSMIAKVSHRTAEKAEMRTQISDLTANMATLTAALNVIHSRGRTRTHLTSSWNEPSGSRALWSVSSFDVYWCHHRFTGRATKYISPCTLITI